MQVDTYTHMYTSGLMLMFMLMCLLVLTFCNYNHTHMYAALVYVHGSFCLSWFTSNVISGFFLLRVCRCSCTCIYVSIHIRTSIYRCVYIYTYTYTCVYSLMCIYPCTCTYMLFLLDDQVSNTMFNHSACIYLCLRFSLYDCSHVNIG